MNTPNPLVPQGTFADKSKSHVRITVFAILAVHVMLLGVLLIAGCDKKGTEVAGNATDLPTTPPPPPVDPWPTPGANPPSLNPPGGAAPAPSNTIAPPVIPPVVDIPPPPLPPPAPSFTEHTVVKGDSFYSIGKKYSVGYKAIGAENPGVDSARLKIGQKIKIPAPKSASGGSAGSDGSRAADSASVGGETIYSVRSGDNLTKVAKANGTTIRELRAANNLRHDQLKVGQKLKIPGKTPPSVEATTPPPSAPVEALPPSGFPPVPPR